METDFKESGRKSKSDREMDLNELWDAAQEHRNRQQEIQTQVKGLSDNLLKWQFGLLGKKKRDMILGVRQPPTGEEERKSWLESKFRATRLKVKRTVDQSGYQEKIQDSYRIKESRYMVEFHKKFAIPFACVVFTLLGVPMAVTSSRSGKGVSVSLAIAVFLIYYLFLMVGERFADRGMLNPMIAMWSANIILLGVGIPIFLKAIREGSVFSFTLRPRKLDTRDAT